MKIGDIAARTGIAPSAIRFYEASGLLPRPGRGANGYRSYSDGDVERLQMIQIGQRLGFSLEALRNVIGPDTGLAHALVRDLLAARLKEIDAMQAQLAAQRNTILALREQLESEWAAGRCLTLESVAGLPAALRKRGQRAV